MISGAFLQIPYSAEQGNFAKEQGISWGKQGIFDAAANGQKEPAVPVGPILILRPMAATGLRSLIQQALITDLVEQPSLSGPV